MKKVYAFGIASLIIIILFVVFYNNNSANNSTQEKISDKLGIDVSGGTEIAQNNTQGLSW